MPNLVSALKSRVVPAKNYRHVRFLLSAHDVEPMNSDAHYPAGLVTTWDTKETAPTPRHALHKTQSAPVVVGHETVRIRLGNPRMVVFLSESSDSDDEAAPTKIDAQAREAAFKRATVAQEKRVASPALVVEKPATPNRDATPKRHREQVVDQVRKCRSIVEALTRAPSEGPLSKAQRMFLSRRHCAKCSLGTGLTETDGAWSEGSGWVRSTRPNEARSIPGFRRTTFESGPKMAMAMASPKDCQKLSQCLNSDSPSGGRGVEMFMRQRQRADKYTIDELKVPPPRQPVVKGALFAHQVNGLAECVKVAAAARRQQEAVNWRPLAPKRCASVEPDRFSLSFNGDNNLVPRRPYTPAPLFSERQAGGWSGATRPLYIQCFDEGVKPPPAVSMVRSYDEGRRVENFNTLPRGWSAYKAAFNLR